MPTPRSAPFNANWIVARARLTCQPPYPTGGVEGRATLYFSVNVPLFAFIATLGSDVTTPPLTRREGVVTRVFATFVARYLSYVLQRDRDPFQLLIKISAAVKPQCLPAPIQQQRQGMRPHVPRKSKGNCATQRRDADHDSLHPFGVTSTPVTIAVAASVGEGL